MSSVNSVGNGPFAVANANGIAGNKPPMSVWLRLRDHVQVRMRAMALEGVRWLEIWRHSSAGSYGRGSVGIGVVFRM